MFFCLQMVIKTTCHFKQFGVGQILLVVLHDYWYFLHMLNKEITAFASCLSQKWLYPLNAEANFEFL